MGIDGASGPKGPGPIAAPEDTASKATNADGFDVAELTGNDASKTEQAPGDAALTGAIDKVVEEIHAGKLSGLERGFGAVIEQIVKTRYTGMPAAQKRRFTAHLTDILSKDPSVGAHIRDLLKAALETR